jgi:hypothetical protein
MIRSRIPVVALVLAITLALAPAARAQKKGPGEIPGDVFFTIKGQQPFALERLHPGITAALMLTDQQKIALHEALEQTVRDPQLRAAGQALKNNPTATDADRAKTQKAMEDARDQLKQSIDKQLTADQKALVARIQAAFDESQKAVATKLQAEYGQAKGDADRAAKLRERSQEELRDELTERLDKVLNAEQKAAVQQAAIAQMEREDAAAKAKKQK